MKKSIELLTAAVFVALFLITTVLVFSNVIQNLDASLALAIYNADPGGVFATLMILLSEHGRELFWGLVVGVTLVLGSRETKLLAVELGLLFLGGIVVGDALKFFLPRLRPFDAVLGIASRLPSTDTDSSYPSGHALIVSIGAIFSLVKFKQKW